jgi:hypothetical protein
LACRWHAVAACHPGVSVWHVACHLQEVRTIPCRGMPLACCTAA